MMKIVRLMTLLPPPMGGRPNPHRTQDATRKATRANGTCWCEWGCPHCMQATSKEKWTNLRTLRIPHAVWIEPKGLKDTVSSAPNIKQARVLAYASEHSCCDSILSYLRTDQFGVNRLLKPVESMLDSLTFLHLREQLEGFVMQAWSANKGWRKNRNCFRGRKKENI